MKTNQVISRTFFDAEVRQKHKTQMFNANDLMSIYHAKFPTQRKHVQHYFDNASTKEFIEHLIQTERIPANEVIESSKGRNGGTWVHPFVFIDLAMWLDPAFKLQAIKWAFDNLCLLRDTAGNTFKELSETVKDVLQPDNAFIYANEIRLLQGLANIDPGERNHATEAQLTKLNILQNADIKMLRDGITEYEKRKKKLIQLADLI